MKSSLFLRWLVLLGLYLVPSLLLAATESSAVLQSSIFDYPISPYTPGSYAKRSFYYDGIHLGEDIALNEGTAISSIGIGVIKFYGPAPGYGELVVVIEHDLGKNYTFTNAFGNQVTTQYILSIYGHLRKSQQRKPNHPLPLSVGSTVSTGTIIGYVNDAVHNGDGTEHLHMGIRLSNAETAKKRDGGKWFRGYDNKDKKKVKVGSDFAAASKVIEILRQNSPLSLQKPILINPTNGSSKTPLTGQAFSWNKVEGAENYRIVISTKSDFSDFVDTKDEKKCNNSITCFTDTTSAEVTSYSKSTFSAGTIYYWKVRGGNSELGGGNWSETRSFTTVCLPFEDVCPQEWYTPFIMKLFGEDIIHGYEGGTMFKPQQSITRSESSSMVLKSLENPSLSESDLLSDTSRPNDEMNRAEAVKLVISAFPELQDALKKFQERQKLGEQPSTPFLDVDDPDSWYFPYIYVAKEKGLLGGYPDHTFRPEQFMTRAEMAKLICTATYGPEECIAKGEVPIVPPDQDPQPICEPLVNSVEPTTAILNQATEFSVKGQCLPETTALWIDQCSNVSSLGGNEQSRQFSCTPSYSAGTKSGTVKTQANGNTLKDFTIGVQAPQPVCSPTVSSVSPTSAMLNQTTTFTVTGQCLPDTTAFWIDQCSNVSSLGGNAQSRQFSCTPSYSGGTKSGIVKTQTNGNTLKDFTIGVQAPQPVCSPTVSSVSPTSAMLNQSTTFTVTGQCLPDTTAFWIDQCSNVTSLGGNAQSRQFSCTPSYSAGTKSGTVKTQANGNTLKDFTIGIQAPPPVCSPTVSSVSPLTATLNQSTTFTVTGQCLPDTTAFWIDQCSNVTSLGGNAQSRQFSCTPSYSAGIKSGIVKDRPNGTVLKNFNLTVPEPPPVCTKPSVSSVSPVLVKLNQSTVFTVTGQCLPDSTAFWIGECANLVSRGGNSQTRTFECTPSYTKGTKSGVVKDRTGGTELTKFTVTVQ